MSPLCRDSEELYVGDTALRPRDIIGEEIGKRTGEIGKPRKAFSDLANADTISQIRAQIYVFTKSQTDNIATRKWLLKFLDGGKAQGPGCLEWLVDTLTKEDSKTDRDVNDAFQQCEKLLQKLKTWYTPEFLRTIRAETHDLRVQLHEQHEANEVLRQQIRLLSSAGLSTRLLEIASNAELVTKICYLTKLREDSLATSAKTIAKLRRANTRGRAAEKELIAEIHRLREKAKSAYELTVELKNVQSWKAQLEGENKRYLEQIKELKETTPSAYRDIQKELQCMEANYESVTKKLSAAYKSIDILEDDKAGLLQSNKLSLDIEVALTQDKVHMQEEIQRLQEEIRSAADDLKTVKSENTRLELSNNVFLQRITEVKKETPSAYRDVRHKLQCLEDKHEAMEKDLSVAHRSIRVLEDEKTRLLQINKSSFDLEVALTREKVHMQEDMNRLAGVLKDLTSALSGSEGGMIEKSVLFKILAGAMPDA